MFHSSNRTRRSLTLEDLQRAVPSAFATAPHESRSDRYAYIPTSNVITAMMRAGFMPVDARQSGSRIAGKAEYTKHMLRFRHADAQLANVGDTAPEVILINSHDGTSAYQLMGGLYRLVCSNGMVVSDSTIASLSVHHKGDIASKVIEGSFQIVQQSARVLDVVKEWGALQLTNGEQTALAEAAHTLRFADSEGAVTTPITPAQMLHVRRSEDARPDLYSTFNRIQENAIRGGLTARAPRQPYERRGRRVSTREVRGIDQDVRLNRALWQLGEHMAKLKGMQLASNVA